MDGIFVEQEREREIGERKKGGKESLLFFGGGSWGMGKEPNLFHLFTT